jgi:sugar phosphate isomerase/epimerase
MFLLLAMNYSITRRDFFRASGLAIASFGLLPNPIAAIEPFSRSAPPRLRLSLAAYSFRDYFKEANHKRESDRASLKQLDMFQFVDYCAEHGCQGAEVTSYYFPEKITNDYLVKLKRHAFLHGVEISGTAVGNDFIYPPGKDRDEQIASVKTWIDRAFVLGAPHIRVFAGSAKNVSKVEAKTLCLSAIEECADYAGGKGIFLGLENHGGIVAEADDLLAIVRAVKSPWLGINLDTGNFHTDDPYNDIAKCAPYAVNVQLKGEVQKRGAKQEPADLKRLVTILHEANYQGYVALEYESAEDPWKAVPGLLKRLKGLFEE